MELNPKNFGGVFLLALAFVTGIAITMNMGKSQDIRGRAADSVYGCLPSGQACKSRTECCSPNNCNIAVGQTVGTCSLPAPTPIVKCFFNATLNACWPCTQVGKTWCGGVLEYSVLKCEANHIVSETKCSLGYGCSNGVCLTGPPTSTPKPTPTSTPTRKPTATPTKKPTSTPTRKPTSTPTRKPTPTPIPGYCGAMKCEYGCTNTVKGGTCWSCPTIGDTYCGGYNNQMRYRCDANHEWSATKCLNACVNGQCL